MTNNKGLHYKDVFLIPSYFNGTSRSNINTQCKLGKFTFGVPVIPANMKCSISYALAETLSYGLTAPYIMHRFDDTFEFVKKANANKLNFISISVGVKEEDKQLLLKIKEDSAQLRVDCITIDIAHGHCKLMEDMINFIKNTLDYKGILIAGNIGTPEAALDLIKWGADCIKIGIGPGAACTTKLKTGFVTPMFSTILNIKNYLLDCTNMHSSLFQKALITPLIADGGINCVGDMMKAFVAGANFVMCGKIFAELIDSPADIVSTNTGKYKEYYGSASQFNKGHNNNIEGKMELIPLNNLTYLEKYKEIKQDIQSGISYSGKFDLNLRGCKWGIQNI